MSLGGLDGRPEGLPSLGGSSHPDTIPVLGPGLAGSPVTQGAVQFQEEQMPPEVPASDQAAPQTALLDAKTRSF